MAVRWLGTTFGETAAAIKGPHLAGVPKKAGASKGPRPIKIERLHAYTRIIISFSALAFGALLVLGDSSAETQAFGTGLIGTVVGYWLK